MRDCRRERLGMLRFLSLLQVLLGQNTRFYLFCGVAHEDNDCLLALISLLLDFNREKPVVKIFNHGLAFASHQRVVRIRLDPAYLLVKAFLIWRIENNLLPDDILDRLVLVHLLDPVYHFIRVIDATIHEQIHIKVCEQLLLLIKSIIIVYMPASSAPGVYVFVLVEIELFGGFVHKEDKTGLFVHDDNAFLQVVEQLFIAGTQNLRLDEQ